MNYSISQLKKNSDNGSTTATVLGIVMFLGIIFVSIGFLVNTSIITALNYKNSLAIKKKLVEKGQEFMKVLYDDKNRLYDSKFSLVMDFVNNNYSIEDSNGTPGPDETVGPDGTPEPDETVAPNGTPEPDETVGPDGTPGPDETTRAKKSEFRITVELKDIGSAFNPNIIHPEFLHYLDQTLFLPPERLFVDPNNFNDQTIRDFWTKTGIHYNLYPDYKDYFSEENLKKYFTTYTYFNINLTDEFVLEKLCSERLNSKSDGKTLHNKITALLGNPDPLKRMINTNEELSKWWITTNPSGLLILDFDDKMWPILNTEPQMNVHFVSEEILTALLTYQPFGIGDEAFIKNRKAQILALRDNPDKKGLTSDELHNIIGDHPYPGMRIYQYLGTYTNFWELKVKGGDHVLRWVIARIPKKKITDDVTYKIIEEDYN